MKEQAIAKNLNHDNILSDLACKNAQAIRLNPDQTDFRPPFFRDVDRIIYSLSYTRYLDKTQVFTNCDNDNVSKRITHVQMVSKIARTIGRALKLNEDLIEAAALGHDIGHVPFGHAGEKILNEISLAHNEGYFNHNIQSVRNLMFVENNGKGCNLTVQVLDAIMCHNGELEMPIYQPKAKTVGQFTEEYLTSYNEKDVCLKMIPMTLEGCVVKISDIIAYLGKDIEDAIRLKKLDVSDIPTSIKAKIKITNKDIINTFVNDIILNSYGQNKIVMSLEKFELLQELKNFNYQFIYLQANSPDTLKLWQKMFTTVFDYSLKSIKENNQIAPIYQVFLNNMDENYLKNTSDGRKVIDFIAGMTDDYLIKQYNLLDK